MPGMLPAGWHRYEFAPPYDSSCPPLLLVLLHLATRYSRFCSLLTLLATTRAYLILLRTPLLAAQYVTKCYSLDYLLLTLFATVHTRDVTDYCTCELPAGWRG
jgi:hypothetical protein